jgi:hypothetical protein
MKAETNNHAMSALLLEMISTLDHVCLLLRETRNALDVCPAAILKSSISPEIPRFGTRSPSEKPETARPIQHKVFNRRRDRVMSLVSYLLGTSQSR